MALIESVTHSSSRSTPAPPTRVVGGGVGPTLWGALMTGHLGVTYIAIFDRSVLSS